MAHVLFGEMGYECRARNKPSKKFPEGRPKMDDEALAKIDIPFVKNYREIGDMKKDRRHLISEGTTRKPLPV
jgi:hypothetical protein